MDLPALYVAAINAPLHAMGMSHEVAHIHVGLIIYIGMQMVLRTRRASGIALQAVLGAELVNEILEWAFYGSWRWPDTLSDIAMTMLWPTILYAVAKFRRARWRATRNRAVRGERLLRDARALAAVAELAEKTQRV